VIAELLDLAVRDGDLRDALLTRGRQRLDEYAPEVALSALREAVDAALGRTRLRVG
jgi:hypothetical protein